MTRRRPEVLISNDDGIKSPGIQLLAKAISRFANVTVVAPEKEQSAMGHALTLHTPVRLYHYAKKGMADQWAVSGTPADCVFMGIRHLMKKKPDLIVSGVNRGANLGNDIFYSGTVAAAREGALLGIPAMATSLMISHDPMEAHGKVYFEDAAQYMAHLAKQVLKNGMPPGCMFNVNYPNLPKNKIKGARASTQGSRYYSNKAARRLDPRGKAYFWLGGQYTGFKAIEGSDCMLIDQGYISITPCRLDVTQYESLETLSRWKLLP